MTGFSPYYLMFGQKLLLPIDLIFGTNITNLRVTILPTLKTLSKEWLGHMKLLMTLFRRNRKGTNDIMATESDVQG